MPAGPGQPAVSAPAAGTELPGLRGEFRRVFATGEPGGHRAEVSTQPLHYRDAQGRWQPVDTGLVTRSTGVLGNRGGPVGIDFAPTAASAQLAAVRLPGGTSVGFALKGALPVPGVVQDSTVSYPQALPQVDLRLTSQPQGVKDELVLTGRNTARSFDFPLALRGLTAEIDPSGALLLRDANNTVVASAPRGWMADSAGVSSPEQIGTISEGVRYSLVDGPAGQVLRVTLDDGWLDDPARVYPVVVDPPVALQQTYTDTYVAEDAPTTNFNSDTSLRVGRADPATASRRRGLMKFDLAPYNGATVYKADLRLYNWHSDTCAARSTTVRRVTTGYGSTTVTWADQPATDPTPLASANESHGNEALGCGNARISYDTTAAVRNWVRAPGRTADWTNYGVAVSAGSETDTSYYKTFQSEQAASTNPPTYAIDYDNTPATPALKSPDAGWRFSYSPKLTATYTDPDGDPGKVTFTVTDRSGGTVRTLTSAQVASGSDATVDLAGNPLPAGWYSWSATASDGRQSSSPTGSRLIEVNPADVAPPGRASSRSTSSRTSASPPAPS